MAATPKRIPNGRNFETQACAHNVFETEVLEQWRLLPDGDNRAIATFTAHINEAAAVMRTQASRSNVNSVSVHVERQRRWPSSN